MEPGHRPPPPPGRHISLLNVKNQPIAGPYQPGKDDLLTAIKHNSEIVGWIALNRDTHPKNDFDLELQEVLEESFILISGLVILLSAALAIPLSHLIVRPIQNLTLGANAIAGGDLTHRVDIVSKDELGELSRDFNQLAHILEQNESTRKRWIADISHELRTPLAITSGELEAMEDGVRPLNIENIRSARDEIRHLQRLVDDLYQLTNADIGALNYQKKLFNLNEMIQTSSETFLLFSNKSALKTQINMPDKSISIYGDAIRIKQLVQNILSNSLKYTDSPGEIRVSLKKITKDSRSFAQILIEDSAPNVASEHLEKLFDHLYRVEGSRNRETGGSGLGLSISKSIVNAHDGDIRAAASELGGLAITVELPLT